MQPVLAPLLPHMLARLSSRWAAILSTGRHLNGQAHPEDTNPATTDEVVEERLVRELTREHLALLCNMADKLLPGSSIGTGAGQVPLLLVSLLNKTFASSHVLLSGIF